MMHLSRIATLAAGGVTLLAVLTGVSSAASESIAPEAQQLNDILQRTAGQTAVFLDQFSDVKCTEQVRQEKLGKDNKVQLKEESTYDYLVILTNTGGELNLSESRIPVHEAKKDRKNTSMEAQERVGLMLNVRKENLAAVLGVLPALQKPTISHLSDEDWLAVNTVIDESAAWDVIPRLKEAQAHGIVEYPLNKVVL